MEGLNVFVYHTGSNCLNLHITDDRIDVVGNQGGLAVIHGHAPLLCPIGGNKIIQEIRYFLIVGRKKSTGVDLVLNLCFPFQSLFMGMPGFPLLFRFSIFVYVVVNNRICFFSFDDGCDDRSSFLCPLERLSV